MTPEFIAGTINGITQGLIGHPLDTIKVLQQNKQKWFGLPIKNYYLGLAYPLYGQIIKNSLTFDMNSRLVNMNITNNFVTGGITGMYMSPILYYIDVFKIRRQTGTSLRFYDFINYKGILLTTLRESIGCSLYLGSYFKLREYEYNSFIAGGTAGIINWTFSYPIDVVRTRQITYNFPIVDCIKYGSLYRGLTLCCLRSFIVSSLGFTIYEKTLNLIKRNN